MEHLGSSGPLPTEPENLPQGQGWAWPPAQGRVGGWKLCPPKLLSQALQRSQLHSGIQTELASCQGEAAASDAPIFWNRVLSNVLL